MTVERWQKIKEIFAEAGEMPADRREGYLKSACRDDVELLREVASLLARTESSGCVPATAVAQPTQAADEGDPTVLAPGTRVGGYRIISLLGCGGMGAVYRAEQDRPKRQVALKLIRPGIMTPSMLRRFKFEA